MQRYPSYQALQTIEDSHPPGCLPEAAPTVWASAPILGLGHFVPYQPFSAWFIHLFLGFVHLSYARSENILLHLHARKANQAEKAKSH